jgi:hypothetical protein
LEELIGEEILDEFDLKGANALPASSYVPAEAQRAVEAANKLTVDAKAKSSGNITPVEGSMANLRVAQGLLAIRLATSTNTNPGKSNRSNNVLRRGGTTTPNTGGGGALPHQDDSSLTLPAREDAASASDIATVVEASTAPDDASGLHSTVRPGLPGIHFVTSATGPEDGITISKPGTPKKHAFKSLIVGEGGTPGLDKRPDPMNKEVPKGE